MMNTDEMMALADALAQLDATPDNGGRAWRHKKRGTTYRIVGEAGLQAAAPITEGELLVIYRADIGGKLWARPAGEFYDGRFEALGRPYHPDVIGSGGGS